LSTTLLAVLSCATTAFGDPAGEQKATAETLFEEGRALVEHGSYQEACPKFAESQRLEPGIGTMLWLADCLENDGQTASAWATFREAASMAGVRHDPREQVARARADALKPRLSHLAISVPPASAVEGLEVLRDGVLLGHAAWSSPVPVDPGSHSVVARAPRHRTWMVTIVVHPDASSLEISVPALEPVTLRPPLEDAAEPTVPREQPGHQPAAWRTVGLIAAGVGIVGVGFGTVLSFAAKSRYDDSNQGGHCLPDDSCDALGKQDRSDANGLALGATVAMGAGAAALAGGAVLYFTAPQGPMRLTIQPTASGLSLRGALRF
jgi:serine/threonine-protein kinase